MKHATFLSCRQYLLWAAGASLLWASAGSAQVNDHSQIVQPDEVADASAWFDGRVAAFAGSAPKDWSSIVRRISQGWGPFEHGWQVNHDPIKLNGKIFETGFGSHANAVVEVSLPADAVKFSALCGVDDTVEARTAQHPVVFTVLADGREVFRSKPQTATVAPAAIDLDVHGVHTLTLKADGTAALEYTPVDFADVRVTLASGESHELGQRQSLSGDTGGCFSFVYGGKASAELLSSWKFQSEPLPPEPDRTGQRFTWTDPATGLQTDVEMKRYLKYPVVEWVQHFRNTGSQPTPILEKIESLDARFPADDQLLLHHNTGDYAAPDSYQPFVTPLVADQPLHFAPNGGRPTDHAWPYFNVEQPRENRGAIVAIAWPGQWAAEFSRDAVDSALRVRGGQELIHTRLNTGEDIRTPLSVVMFYRGDVTRAQNLWRRWMLDCNVPKPHGALPPAIHSVSLGLHQSEKTEIDGIKLYTAEHAGLTHWWMDAGWYPCNTGEGGWWPVGTWEPDPQRFPNGIRPVSDVAHANGLKMILWLEPERVHVGTELDKTHPDWLLHNANQPEERLFDLGNPTAWHWLEDHLDTLFTTQGIDLYRQDFNFEPLPYWRAHDTPDRQGMTEMRHVEGYLALWDELHRRHPDMLIDTCASGGRRLDLETLRRSISLWRSDDNNKPEDEQSHTYGLASWVPYYGSGTGCTSKYVARSIMLPFLSLGADHDNWDLYRSESAIWSAIQPDLLGDYYPLTPYTLSDDQWIGWQFDRPDLGNGVVQVFRRGKSPYTEARFPLCGLDAEASYIVTNVDAPQDAQTISGKVLMEQGVQVQMREKPAAVVVRYVKTKK